MRNIFATVLTTITTIWRPGLKLKPASQGCTLCILICIGLASIVENIQFIFGQFGDGLKILDAWKERKIWQLVRPI